jgi:hypothetical protein
LELANYFSGVLHGFIGVRDRKEFEFENFISMEGEKDLE